ncbi:hypothetical protein SAMN05660909_04767, partial [Chitinophaga terrae (ex Kim and Jung 2007)]
MNVHNLLIVNILLRNHKKIYKKKKSEDISSDHDWEAPLLYYGEKASDDALCFFLHALYVSLINSI